MHKEFIQPESVLISKSCKNISDEVGRLEKEIRRKPYVGLMLRWAKKNCKPDKWTLTEREYDIQRKHRTSELPGILTDLKKMLKKLWTSLISVADDGLILPQSLRPACAACADQSAVDWLYKVLNGILFAI